MSWALYTIKTESRGFISTCPAPSRQSLSHEALSKEHQIDHMVSLVGDLEFKMLGLDQWYPEESVSSSVTKFPIVDYGVPSNFEEATQLIGKLAALVQNGKHVVVHCKAGIGRSSTIAIATLVRLGWPLEKAMDDLSDIRGRRVPETESQRAFLERFAQSMPG